MGRGVWFACTFAAVAGCFADLGGFSGGDGAGPDGGAPSRDGGGDGPAPPPPPPGTPPPPAPADAGADATVFVDSFDDPAPLPRAWTSATGAPTIVSSTAAPSAPNVLDSFVAGDAGGGAFLKKTVDTFGAKKVSCSFAVQLLAGSHVNYVIAARLEVDATVYVRFDLDPDSWHYYGQQGATEYGNRILRPETGEWNHVTLTMATDGTVTVTVDGDTHTSTIAPLTASAIHFSLGVQLPVSPDNVETRYDDVRCTAE